MRLLLIVILTSLFMSSCDRATSEVYTSAAGTVDSNPTFTGSPYKISPPLPNGEYPDERYVGARLQSTADEMIGTQVAKFVAHREVYSVFRNEEMHAFFPLARAGVNPGMCQARPFHVILRWRKRGEEVVRIGWRETLNGVAGSVAPMPKHWSNAYRTELANACASRRDLGWWFLATPSDAYLAARLTDNVVASGRQHGELPFTLKCKPFAPGSDGVRPLCETDVRKIVSGINPRAIMSITSCASSKQGKCLDVAVAKNPAGSDVETDQWNLQITFTQKDDTLKIDHVDLLDTRIIIE